ncbi:FAD-linked oxidase C-terminal domain-containing protein [Pseudarthrobacter sp. AL07]|uniref:FAD-binding and (Fe-S)-binding domain-containing protein n=1 Tax=unclassified Pseudarthrobacter TaxID=2647000 RepID=UPI00249CD13B|nr:MULTISPECIES: FAD-binding and (Fe-S)-binding domain-containing protein [unclassified Pseudarthrobacter]MDI3195450.1 FAD-linked oxidase C-terminal domain-containing protein [Pseudarthrobacter sp. AL20]MDI3209517.1 FAD-linked oxidase C-terminal domain-containing protein [Pseudarthrobacter sp. AL07]
MVTSVQTPRSLASLLRSRGIADVRDDALSRAAYSSDASLYRVEPSVVVFPRSTDEVLAAMEACRERGISLTARGAGTSVAGNAVGSGVIMDFSRYMNKVLSLDVEARTAVVEPGTVHATLQKAALAQGLRFGPDPSTHTRCTIGGMIGNNACGSRTLAYGRTSDNVTHLDVVTGSGQRLFLGPDGTPSTPQTDALRSLVGGGLETIRTELGRFGRQVSGYSLEHLLPERRFDLRRALVGSEGTLAVVLEAGVRLVADARHKTMVVLGFENIGAAGDAVMQVLPFSPTACEGMDRRIVDVVANRRGAAAVPDLPAGAAWLFVEISGDDPLEIRERAAKLALLEAAKESRVVTDQTQAARLWKIREDGAGLAGRSPVGVPAHSGWEDAAVPPAELGNYLRDFDKLLIRHRLTGFPYGHFGDGCVHVRLDLPLAHPGGTAAFRAFMSDAAELVAGYGGSLSGEHGDGRARSELLPYMYSADAIRMFANVKHILDPDNLLNPGIIVDPRPLDADVRVALARPVTKGLAWAYHDDKGDFSQAVHRCTGVGKCRADNTGDKVMCPSFLATREEKDSTRGRARVLQEMINKGGTNWRAPEVHDALDLCLSCKGCASDCPTGVDMAAYKAEVLHQSYKGRLRPMAHYTLGWLPRWAALASRAPRLVNAMMRLPGLGPLSLRFAGVDGRRSIPEFAQQTFHGWFSSRTEVPGERAHTVLLWVDSFTNYFSPEIGQAAVRVLEAAGVKVVIPEEPLCCGLTWISTGQLDSARKILGRTVETLTAAAEAGTPIVGVEPSCTAVLRSDALELLGADAAQPVANATRTLAEYLVTLPGYSPPSLAGQSVVAQPHCHHHAVMGWSPDAELLKEAGAKLEQLGGCCGLAGNFGVERGHYDISVAVAEQQLLPAVRAAAPDALVLADGFSCRTQLEDLTDRRGLHLAQLLDQAAEPPS